MERLDLSIAPERPNIEAAIHFARYAICKNLVTGKRVLDVACGEGYGSYMLKQAGAEHVVGVDVSQETITEAKRLFAQEGLSFQTADAASLDSLFNEGEFDVVISIETIEHLGDPVKFLSAIKRITNPNGVIIVSCPNDHWYYPQENQANPYHLRKYRFEEFKKISTDILGHNVMWSIGTGVFGFGSTPLDVSESYSTIPGSWMSYMDVNNAYMVNGEKKNLLSKEESSYFLGVWNAPERTTGVAVFPLPMNDYASMAVANDTKMSLIHVQQALQSANEENAGLKQALESANEESSRVARQFGLRFHASRAECETMRETNSALRLECETMRETNSALRLECETMRETNSALRLECETMRVGYFRYVRLSRLVPSHLRSLVVRIFRFIRG